MNLEEIYSSKHETIDLDELKDSSGNFKYDEASEQFGMTTHMQYDILLASIKDNGQLEPIFIYRGRIVDGRNRCKALHELGIETVKVKKLPYMLTLDDRIKLAQNTEFSRRHQTATQIACDAVKIYSSTEDRFKILKANDPSLRKADYVSKADILRKTGASSTYFSAGRWLLENQPLIFKRLFDGEKIALDPNVPNKATDNLVSIKKHYKDILDSIERERVERELDEKAERDMASEEMDEESNASDSGSMNSPDEQQALKNIENAFIAILAPYNLEPYNINLRKALGHLWGVMREAEELKAQEAQVVKSL